MSTKVPVVRVILMLLGLLQISWESNCVTQVTDAGGRVVLPGLYEIAWVQNDSEIIVIDGADHTDGGCDSPSVYGGKYGLYSVDGSVLLPVIYDGIYHLKGDLYQVNRGGVCDGKGCNSGEWALYFARQKKLTAFAYSEVYTYYGRPDTFRLSAGCHCDYSHTGDYGCDDKNCRYGLVNSENGVLAEPIYDVIRPGEDGTHFVLEKASKFGVMDRRGKMILPMAEGGVEILGSGRFARFRGKSAALFDEGGKALSDYKYLKIKPFQGGLAHAYADISCTGEGCISGAWFILDVSGKTLAGPFEQILWRPQIEVAAVLEGKSWSLRDLRGKLINKLKFKTASIENPDSTDGIFLKATTEQGVTTLFDRKGKILYQGQSAEVRPCGAQFCCSSEGKYGLCSKTGQVLLTFEYDGIEPLKNGTFEVELDNKKGLADSKGKILIPPKCTMVEAGRGFVVCEIRGKKRTPDESGKAGDDFINEFTLFDYQGRKINGQPFTSFRLEEDDSSSAVRGENCFRIRDDGSPAFTMKCSDLSCSRRFCTFDGPGGDGVVDYSGKILLSGDYVEDDRWENYRKFTVGTDCSGGYCATKEVFYFDLNGRRLAKPPVDESAKKPKFRQNQVCEARCTGKRVQTILLDKLGKEVAIPTLAEIGRFGNGSAVVTGEAGPGDPGPRQDFTGVIDETGKGIIPLKYSWASNLESGYVRVFEGGVCPTDRVGKEHCRGGIWKILDSRGQEVTILKDLQAPNPIMGGSLLVTDLKGEKERLIDVQGKVLYEFRYSSNFEHYPWQGPQSHPWFYEDASGRDGEPKRWISVKGQVLGRPDSEMKLIGEGAEALLLEQESRGDRYHLYAKTGEKILSTACRRFLTTTRGFVCDERAEDKSGGGLAFYDRQGKNVCALERSHAGNRALPACMTGAPAAMPAPKPAATQAAKPIRTAFALVEVIRDHVIVRDAAGNYAALTPQGRWVSGFGQSWLIPTGEKNVYYFDPGLWGGKRHAEAVAFGLKDGSGRVLTSESYRAMGPFRGGLTAVARRTRDDSERSYEGLINTQGKLVLDDPDATIVQISGGTALVTLEKPYPGTSAKQFITIALDAQGRELVRMPDTDARQGDGDWLERKESDRKTGFFVFTVHSDCNLYPDYRICKKRTLGLMDTRGRVLLKNIYASLQIIGNGLFAVRPAANCRKVNCADVPYSIINLQGKPFSRDTYLSVKPMGDAGVFEAQKCGN